MEAVNIYGKAFLTMNSITSSKNNSRGSHKSGMGSRDPKSKFLTNSSNLKNLTSKNSRPKRVQKTRESYRVRSPKQKTRKSQDFIQKSTAKSRSNEPKKQKKQPHRIASKKRKKTNLFMKSRSRSMSSTSDVSPNRSRSLNKTNSELKKSGSFIEIDQHLGKVIYGYQIQEPLGEGAYAKVYRALHVNTKTPVAIKGMIKINMLIKIVYNKSHLSITRETSIKQEIKVLIEIKHPNIVTFVDCFSSSTHIYIVMELIEGRNLFSYFKKLWGQFSPSKRYKRSSMDIPDHLLKVFYERHKKILRLVIGQVSRGN